MRFIRDIYQEARPTGRPVISFEFFTPKTDEGEQSFYRNTLPRLAARSPDYCSVTYGAGGSTRDKTLAMVERIQTEFRIPTMAHLTCVGSNREQILALLDEARRRGIANILALRGDPPAGTGAFAAPEGGFTYAHELVSLLHQLGGFSVAVAGFPEGHLECRAGRHQDWEHLKRKIDCGADLVITQLFFDNDLFYEFRDHLVGRLGVAVPIVPGVMPILSTSQINKFVALCGATVPLGVQRRLAERAHDDAACAEFGVEFATRQCEDLLRNGVPGLHFYTVNKAASTCRILDNLGLNRV
ncbi:MAG: methylenetetrahydrofolate reductase [NAD(P)H] [Verrucomicrobia bacterium]|nr:methylenetetrahydrofolate reductase [NAD(P)H] [Verrucomicrobiota bacterium]